MAGKLASFRTLVASVRSAELVAFAVEDWHEVVARYGGPAAVVRSQVRYNGSARPSPFRTIWVQVDGVWHTTATGKFKVG